MIRNRRKLSKWNKSNLLSALESFEEKVNLGFSDENFEDIAKSMRVIKQHLPVAEFQALEAHWRNSYTDDCDPVALSKDVEYFKTEFKL